MESLPIIDLAKAKGKLEERKEVAVQLVKALQDVGFLFLDNVEGYNHQELHRATEWFFSLHLEKRMQLARQQWNQKSKFVYRGYFPLEERDSYKEGIEFGAMELSPDDPDRKLVMYEPNQWPEEDGSIPFRQIMVQYCDVMSRTAIQVVRLIALGLGMDEHYFDKLFITKPLSTLRLLHYPPRDTPPSPQLRDGDLVIQCAQHYDFSFATFLATFHYWGLQIKTDEDKWMDVEPRPDSLVMNIGETLVRMTQHCLKATVHRVIDRGVRRYSVPFFVEPHYRANVGDTETVLYGPWMIRKIIKNNTEYCNSDFGDIDV